MSVNRKLQHQQHRYSNPATAKRIAGVFFVVALMNILFWGGLLFAILWVLSLFGVI